MIETDIRLQPERTLLGIFARSPMFSLVVFVVMSTLAGIGYYDPTLLVAPPEIGEAAATAAGGMSGGRRGRDGSVPQPRSRVAPGGPAPDVTPVMLFGGEVMLLLHGEDFFNPTAALAIREAVEALEALPQVRLVMWMDRAPPLNLFGLPEPALPDHRASQRRFDAARQRALDNPMIAGQLLSADGKTLMLSIRMDWFHVRSNADCTSHLAEVVRGVLKSHDLDFEVGVTGEMPIRLVMSAASQDNDRKFQYIANGVILVLALILFRGPSAVIVSALGAIFGVVWTMGCIRFFQFEDNPFNHVVVPVLLSLVGFTDGVHMVSQIRFNRSLGLAVRPALVRAVDEVGMACFLTSLTTAIGLGSLGWAYHQVVREFGWSCVMGVGITFLAIMTTIPLACLTPLGRGVHRGQGKGWIEQHLEHGTRLVVMVLRRRKAFSVLALVLTVITGVITLRLQPDERMLNAIPERSSEARWLRHIDRAFGGLETAHVLATWDADIAAESPEVVAVSEEVENLLREEPLLGNPLGIARLIDALPGEASAVSKASMLELLPPQLRRVFLLPEQRSLKVIFRLQDLGIAKYGQVFERLDERLAAIQAAHPGFTLSLEGSAFWRWQNLYQIMVDLTKSLGTASLVIFLVLAAVYRSLRLGLIAIIPNLLPLTVTGSLMLLVGQPLELVSVIAFTVCLGIAVDDTIHFLTRYRMELSRGGELEDVITRAFRGVGSAMIMTTLVLVCGFTTVLWSDTREHHIFAMMGAATMVTALFADLLFLPALIAVFDRPQRE
jgi:predicted RND superfamily exporter protein